MEHLPHLPRLLYSSLTERLFGKPKPKKINISSEMNNVIITGGLEDMAAVEGTTASDVAERLLMSGILPTDKDAAEYVARVQLAHCSGDPAFACGVDDALIDIFDRVRACEEARLASRPLVEFVMGKASATSVLLDDDSLRAWQALRAELDAFAHKVDGEEDEAIVASVATRLENEAKCGETKISSLIACILADWDLLGGLTSTYEFMSSAVSAAGSCWDSPEDRLAFKGVCDQFFPAWRDEQNRRSNVQGADAFSGMASYDIADRGRVVVPRNWIVANPERGIDSHYVGVMEVKNGEPYLAPHVLFFLDKPLNAISKQEHADILQCIASVWPELSDVLADKVDLKYGSDGGVLNQREYVMSPQVGLFAIREKEQFPYGEPPYGAYIERAGAGGDDR